MEKIFRSYQVWPKFPSISMSGNSCALSCKHCNHTYLSDMQNLTKSEELLTACKRFKKEGAVGVLLSGGCDKNGEMLNLRKLLPTIKKIKKETDLIMKLHTGIVSTELAVKIVDAGIDIASVEIVGSNETIKEIFDLNISVDSYIDTLHSLESARMPYIVPHVCIGLHYGELKEEFHALDLINNFCDPALLVFIIFRPTKGTPLEHCKIPSAQDVTTIIERARYIFPNKELSLGCIRPRATDREEIEIAAVKAGVTRMEIPSKTTIQYAKKNGYSIKTINACCALPKELEPTK